MSVARAARRTRHAGRGALLLASAVAASCGHAPARAPSGGARVTFPSRWPFTPGAGGVIAPHAMVVSDDARATAIGRDVLAAGGNAVDAAIATAFALAVVHPAAGNLGGGGFLVARVGGRAYALDFRELAPRGATATMFSTADGASSAVERVERVERVEGHRSCAVPGTVAGLWEAHRRLGKAPWRALVAPATALASAGSPVDAALAASLRDGEIARLLTAQPASAALYYPGGQPLAEGAVLRNLDLARALERVADQGADGFYRGATADAVAAEMRRGGGLVTTDDLRDYRPAWRAPLELEYRGHHVTTMPLPSAGGVTLAMIAHVAEGLRLGSHPWQSLEPARARLETLRRVYVAREHRLGDPDLLARPIDDLLSATWASAQREAIAAGAPPVVAPATRAAGAREAVHTTHLSVVDGDGSAVALTTTLDGWFGSGVTVAGAGFLLNGEMAEFAPSPTFVRADGVREDEPNAIGPRKRMLSSMAPTIVSDASGEVELVLGAAGGPAIASTVFQLLSDVVDFGLDLPTAVAAPRLHLQDVPDVVAYERFGLDEPLRRPLEALGYAFKPREHLADAPCIGRTPDGWIGVAEPRREASRALGL